MVGRKVLAEELLELGFTAQSRLFLLIGAARLRGKVRSWRRVGLLAIVPDASQLCLMLCRFEQKAFLFEPAAG